MIRPASSARGKPPHTVFSGNSDSISEILLMSAPACRNSRLPSATVPLMPLSIAGQSSCRNSSHWRDALVVVYPDTLIFWRRKGFRLSWCRKSRPVGRLRLPRDVQELIREMPAEDPIWGGANIATVYCGLQVSS